jgi:hypothetical protein
MAKHTINLPDRTLIRNVNGEGFYIDWAKVPAAVIAQAVEGGAKIIFTNAYNGGGKDTPDADRLRNMERRRAAWERGEYALTNSGPRESIIGEMREAFIAKQVSLGKTVKQAEESIRATVTAAFGKDEKATFPRFLDAVATMKSKANGTDFEAVREELEKAALEAVEAVRKERAEAGASIEVDADNLF